MENKTYKNVSIHIMQYMSDQVDNKITLHIKGDLLVDGDNYLLQYDEYAEDSVEVIKVNLAITEHGIIINKLGHIKTELRIDDSRGNFKGEYVVSGEYTFDMEVQSKEYSLTVGNDFLSLDTKYVLILSGQFVGENNMKILVDLREN